MPTLWQTGIPKNVYASLYCSWRRVKREVAILSKIFSKYQAKKLIEFGCGLGRHGYALSKMGFNVLLTDVRDWRFGVARRTPFAKLDILDSNGIVNDVFDGGYAINFLTIFNYSDMVNALRNIGKIIGRGVFVADYNFQLYNEPREVVVKVGKKVYKALLEREEVKVVDGGVLYSYRVKVVDNNNNVIGVEEASYPVYRKEVVFRAIKEAGLKIVDLVWTSWDPVAYLYTPSENESDSAFIVMVKDG